MDRAAKAAGPVNLSKALAGLIPAHVISRYTELRFRLYGGWRSNGILTRFAQKIVPDIRANSPAIYNSISGGVASPIRLLVELAESPISGGVYFENTFVKDRELRKFRAKRLPCSECASAGACGFATYSGVDHSMPCPNAGCAMAFGNVLVRDEQKMVDTLIVADIAYSAIVGKAEHAVVVSSDTDMWPGVLLALQVGCSIVHIHTKTGWRTQGHLMKTLPWRVSARYMQLSM